jgi:bis(5'-nucleosidyl)-tetraphosphatase
MQPPDDKKATRAPLLSAGVVVVHSGDAGWRVLLLRAYRFWDCPKGMVEPGEDALAAATREVREETAISDLDFRWGDVFIETPPYAKGKLARYYLAATRTVHIELPVNPELGRPEHQEGRWFAFDEARAVVVPRIAAVLDWAEQRLRA